MITVAAADYFSLLYEDEANRSRRSQNNKST